MQSIREERAGEPMGLMGMTIYSALLSLALILSAPWWLWRMLTSGRYRAGLAGRLGVVPRELERAVAGRHTIWLHAVSVGEVLAAERLIRQLQAALPGWAIAVSTTTATGNQIARERLKDVPVFFMPLDFAFAMRRSLRALRPGLVVLMESELWPRMLVECKRAGIPVAVANARVSDRSFPRYMRLRRLWRPLLGKVSLFLAQGDESAERLTKIGVPSERVRVAGNLKYDAPPPVEGEMVRALRGNIPAELKLVVCGSTLEGEEALILEAFAHLTRDERQAVLLIAPRHPERFDAVVRLIGPSAVRASEWIAAPRPFASGEIVVLDSLGTLAGVYGLAAVAFVGGSLVPRGGHNPLEPARFGVPIVMGPSYENFREIVEAMRERDAIDIVADGDLAATLERAMAPGQAVAERGRAFFEARTGATGRTVAALLDLLGGTEGA